MDLFSRMINFMGSLQREYCWKYILLRTPLKEYFHLSSLLLIIEV
jgi:hypothetical protein